MTLASNAAAGYRFDYDAQSRLTNETTFWNRRGQSEIPGGERGRSVNPGKYVLTWVGMGGKRRAHAEETESRMWGVLYPVMSRGDRGKQVLGWWRSRRTCVGSDWINQRSAMYAGRRCRTQSPWNEAGTNTRNLGLTPSLPPVPTPPFC